MSIQVYPYNDQEEKVLLDFLKSRHYNYKATDENEIPDAEFLDQYNKELAEAEAQIDKGDYLTHDEVKNSLPKKETGPVVVKWSRPAIFENTLFNNVRQSH